MADTKLSAFSEISGGLAAGDKLFVADASDASADVYVSPDQIAVYAANKLFTTSVSTMVAMTGLADGQAVGTKGYYTAGDGGGNAYIYHTTGRPTADGGFYMNGPGADDYFEAVDKTVANVRQFGAKGNSDGTTGNGQDDTTYIQAAVTAALALDSPAEIYVPPGGYRTTAVLDLGDANDFVFRGAGQTSIIHPDWTSGLQSTDKSAWTAENWAANFSKANTVIWYKGTGGRWVLEHFKIQGVQSDVGGNDLVGVRLGDRQIAGSGVTGNGVIQHVNVRRLSVGFMFDYAFSFTSSHLHALYCELGFDMLVVNACDINFLADGCYCPFLIWGSNGSTFSGLHEHGFLDPRLLTTATIENCKGLTFTSLYFEPAFRVPKTFNIRATGSNGDVDGTANTIAIASHGWATEQLVYYDEGTYAADQIVATNMPESEGHLTRNIALYVRAVDADTIALYGSAADATADTDRIGLTAGSNDQWHALAPNSPSPGWDKALLKIGATEQCKNIRLDSLIASFDDPFPADGSVEAPIIIDDVDGFDCAAWTNRYNSFDVTANAANVNLRTYPGAVNVFSDEAMIPTWNVWPDPWMDTGHPTLTDSANITSAEETATVLARHDRAIAVTTTAVGTTNYATETLRVEDYPQIQSLVGETVGFGYWIQPKQGDYYQAGKPGCYCVLHCLDEDGGILASSTIYYARWQIGRWNFVASEVAIHADTYELQIRYYPAYTGSPDVTGKSDATVYYGGRCVWRGGITYSQRFANFEGKHHATALQPSLRMLTSGSGVPTATAPRGSIYVREDGGPDSSLYVQDSGANANTWTPYKSGAVWTPARAGQLIWWLDASDASTIEDTGGLVDTWTCKHNSALSVASSATARPVTDSDTINDLNVITFDGTNDYLGTADALPRLDQPYSMFCVVKLASISDADRVISSNDLNYRVVFMIKSSGADNWAMYSSSVEMDSAVLATTDTTLLGGIFEGESSTMYVDDASQSGTVGTKQMRGLTLGSHQNRSANFAPMQLAEVLIYDEDMSDRSGDIIEYLSDKWGLELTTTGTQNESQTTETLTATTATCSRTTNITYLDSSSNAITATMPDGKQVGQQKTIIMTDASNSSTVSVTSHETSDPEVFTFDAVGEAWRGLWDGSQWIDIRSTATPVSPVVPMTAAYAYISVEGNSTATTITNSSTDFSNAVQFTGFDTNSADYSDATPDHTNDHITIGTTGVYAITAMATLLTAATSVSCAIFKNNKDTQLGIRASGKCITTQEATMTLSVPCIELTAADTIELWLQNETDTADITFPDVILGVNRIG